MLSRNKQNRINKILEKMGDSITSINDITAGKEPSALFYLLANKLSYLMSNDPDKVISERGVKIRRKLHFIIRMLGPKFLKFPQKFEDRNELLGIEGSDKGIALPDEPVIWCANHSFLEDALAMVLAARRHSYILFGSLPHFFNTFDGITAYINGVVMTNRKISQSRHTSIEKCIRVMNMGTDLIIFPEGGWNKTPDRLMIDLWPGVYRIARETGYKVVPVAHYISDPHGDPKKNPIRTVIDDALDIAGLDEREALTLVRDTISGWYYLMMERYGKSTRDELLKGFPTSQEAWTNYISMHTNAVHYYDRSIETTADYRPKCKIEPTEVWKPLSEIKNITIHNIKHVQYAKTLVAQQRSSYFQKRF